MKLPTREQTLSNGAVLQPLTELCKVCLRRGEEPSEGIFLLEYQCEQIFICKAHTQELLNSEEDWGETKGGIIQEAFSK